MQNEVLNLKCCLTEEIYAETMVEQELLVLSPYGAPNWVSLPLFSIYIYEHETLKNNSCENFARKMAF